MIYQVDSLKRELDNLRQLRSDRSVRDKQASVHQDPSAQTVDSSGSRLAGHMAAVAAELVLDHTSSANRPCKALDLACHFAVAEVVVVAYQDTKAERQADLRQERRTEVVAVAEIQAEQTANCCPCLELVHQSVQRFLLLLSNSHLALLRIDVLSGEQEEARHWLELAAAGSLDIPIATCRLLSLFEASVVEPKSLVDVSGRRTCENISRIFRVPIDSSAC